MIKIHNRLINLDNVEVITDLSVDDASEVQFHIGRDLIQIENFNKEKLISLIITKFSNFQALGNDYINIDLLSSVEINEEVSLELIFISGEIFTYETDELSTQSALEFISQFDSEDITLAEKTMELPPLK